MNNFFNISSTQSNGDTKVANHSNSNNKVWVEKYRPKTVDDVVHQDEIVSVLKNSLKSNNFPNLLFYGPPGTGKTSSIIALARLMFGNEFQSRVLQLNASDDRGIAVIRENVRKFAQYVPMASSAMSFFTRNSQSDTETNGQQQTNTQKVNLKLIILDEADSMTTAAQSCLRRTMEIYSKTTRFCLICNYVSRIIEPIASRCSKFRFKPIAAPLMINRLREICDSEQVCYTDDNVLEHLISVCDGDLRQAITLLQTAHKIAESKLDMDVIHEVSGYIPQTVIDRFLATCRKESFENMSSSVFDLIMEGFTASQFLIQLNDWLVNTDELDDSHASKFAQDLAMAEHRLSNGADETIQLLFVASSLMRVFNSK